MALPQRLKSIFAESYEQIRNGQLRTLIPFLGLFKLNNSPMDLKLHFQLAPMYNTVQAPNTVWMFGRQLGKSYALCSSSALRSALIPAYHQLIIQPRFDQIQRLNSTVYQPLMRSCPLQQEFISNPELAKMALKMYSNGSLVYMENMMISADRVRGVSGAASLYVDESTSGDTELWSINFEKNLASKIKISEIKAGNALVSFDIGAILISVAAKDASPHGVRDCYKLTTEGGRSIVCTSEHCLQTNAGRLRVKDIIYASLERTDKESNGQTAECHNGQSAGGRSYPNVQPYESVHTMESRVRADGVCENEVWPVARVMYETTREKTESGLRRLLGSTVHICNGTICLAVSDVLPGRLRQEARHAGTAGADDASDSAGVVVHGRRQSDEEPERRSDCNKQLLQGGERTAVAVAAGHMGCREQCSGSQSQLVGEGGVCHQAAEAGVRDADAADRSVRAGLHEIQDGRLHDDVCGMRRTDGEGQKALLFAEVRGGLQKDGGCAVCGGACRQAPREETRMESGSQGQHQCRCQKALQRPEPGEEGGTRRIHQNVACGKGREVPAVQTGVQGGDEERSGVHAEAEGGAGALLSACHGGSRTACKADTAGEGLQKASGQARERPPVSSEIQGGCPECGSGEKGCIRCAKSAFAGAAADDGGAAAGAQARPCQRSVPQTTCEHDAGRACRLQGKTGGEGQTGVEGNDGGAEGAEPCQGAGIQSIADSGAEGPQAAAEIRVEEAQTRTGFILPQPGNFFWDPIVKIEYVGKKPVYDIEVTGTHNYILANGICSYNCQDIEFEYLTIAKETMSASLFWGFSIYTGTPKTTDTTLALLWDRSSQSEWVIRCEHCGYFNVPNPEQDLLKMIGKRGPVCAKCGKPIYPQNGGYVAAIPDRLHSFPGYHVSQTIHPVHMLSDLKWGRILDKLDSYRELELYNEVFGWPYDAAVSPLTLADLKNACYNEVDAENNIITIQKPSDINLIAHNYRYISVGVDWSGGGMVSDSYTAIAVLGLRKKSDIIDVLYGKRMPKGMSPSDEADEVLYWLKGSGANAFAYDNGGAGFTRLEIMNHRGLRNLKELTIVPINYVRPHSGDVMKPRAAQREADLYYYTLDKSRSLAVTLMAIKSGRLRFPDFQQEDQDAYQRDFLALREDPRKTLGNEIIMLIIKKPGVPDDFAHAVNFGCSQIWDHFGAYPKIGSKYDAAVLEPDMDPETVEEADLASLYGPRGDFARFCDAVNERAAVVAPNTVF